MNGVLLLGPPALRDCVEVMASSPSGGHPALLFEARVMVRSLRWTWITLGMVGFCERLGRRSWLDGATISVMFAWRSWFPAMKSEPPSAQVSQA